MSDAGDEPPEQTTHEVAGPPDARPSSREAGDDADEASDPELSLRRTIVAVVATTAIVTVASYTTPEPYVATVVGLLFLGATYFLVLRHSAKFVASHGLSLGGLFEPTGLSPKRIAKDAFASLAWALGAFAIVAVPFAIAFPIYFHVHRAFHWQAVTASLELLSGQVLVIALPEEAFFRGFLQTELEPLFARRVRVLGADLSLAIPVASVIFALGHLFTNAQASRLAVFFPSLLFGFLRTRTRGIGASFMFHALCNLLSATLAHGYKIG